MEGGYVLLQAGTVALFAAARKARAIKPGDVRAALVISEMTERRKFTTGKVRYAADEFAKIMGIGLRRAQLMLCRLRRVGLVEYSRGVIRLRKDIAGHPLEAEAAKIVEALGKKSIVMPRRVMSWLAKVADPSLIWTAIGHACRALFRYQGGVRPMGTCKSSWLGSWAPLAVRSIKRARERLISVGWLERIQTPQRSMNRKGALVQVDVAWRAPLAPPTGPGRAPLAPPLDRPSLSEEIADHAPRLDRPSRKDLTDPSRLRDLHKQAIDAGKLEPGPDGAYRFGAIAARVVRTARNVPGLFRWLLDTPSRITGCDLEMARATMERLCPRRITNGPAPVARTTRVPLTPEEREAYRPAGWTPEHEKSLVGLPGNQVCATSHLIAAGVPFELSVAVAKARAGAMYRTSVTLVDPVSGREV